MERFVDDDDGYVAWIDRHPAGFVLNCARTPRLEYLFVHRASCHSISVLGEGMRFWTRDYIKLCSQERGELIAWCYSELGGSPSYCSFCDPMGAPT